jgi:hypothetical protein
MNIVIHRGAQLLLAVLLLGTVASCDSYLDVVPDNVATFEDAFDTRETAQRFLFSLYAYLPEYAHAYGASRENPALTAGDLVWYPSQRDGIEGFPIARGNQRVADPYLNAWRGGNGMDDMYEAIRRCNIFMEKIDTVPSQYMRKPEKIRWKAEARFLKAYYHFYLMRMYGPIVLVKENLPVSASADQAARPRSSIDSTVSFVLREMDQAAENLPGRVRNETSEYGRITEAIALSMKAKVAVTAASPLFNGNTEYQSFTNPDGEQLFDTETDGGAEWERAVEATTEALQVVEDLNYELYTFGPGAVSPSISDTTRTRMSVRNVVAEPANSEIIWASTNPPADFLQAITIPRGLDFDKLGNSDLQGYISPPIRMAEMFYTDKGLPISEDKTWYDEPFDVKTATREERYNLQQDYRTAQLHFDRSSRFYANLGFDGGIWYGQGVTDDDSDDLLWISGKSGDPTSGVIPQQTSATGYYPKKMVNYLNTIQEESYTIREYAWPVLRLADLYLLHAEALNELNGPSSEVYDYVNRVRERAGLPTVQDAWSNYSNSPNKYTTEAGMRDIIHRERKNELAFEGHRFWDLRRWKEAIGPMNRPIRGWTLTGEEPETYYRPRNIHNLNFSSRDYLWPISEQTLLENQNIKQNPGW